VNNGMDVDLLQAKLKIDDELEGLSAVMLASSMGNVDILGLLLQRSRDLNIRSSGRGRTALVIAIENGQTNAAKLLAAQKEIEVETLEEGRLMPLKAAAIYGMADVIPDLVARGADVNGQNGHTSPLVVQAVGYNQTEAAKKLLSSTGIDVNGISRVRGGTALHYAVSWGNAELVELLISHGADLQIRDDVNGFRPIDYALYFNDQRILDLLKASDPKKGVRFD
jgi:ankyrin repeat protein